MKLIWIVQILFIFNIMQLSLAEKCDTISATKFIRSDNGNYIMTTMRVFEGPPPTNLRYYDGDIFYTTDSKSYVIKSGTTKPTLFKHNIKSDTKSAFVDNWGNKVTNSKGVTTVVTLKYRKFTIFTDKGKYTGQMAVDYDKNRVFLIGYDTATSKYGSLYAFNINDLDIIVGRAYVEKIKDIGDRVSAISIDKTSGKIVLVTLINNDKWSLTTLDNVKAESCKMPSERGIYTDALKTAINLAGEQILSLYEDAVLGYERSSRKNVELLNGGGTKSAENSGNTSGSYSQLAADKVCSENLIKVQTKLDNSEAKTKIANEKYDKLYNLIFESKIIQDLKDRVMMNDTKIEALDPSASQDKTKKYVVLLESDFEQLKSEKENAHDMMKRSLKLFETIDDMSINDVFVDPADTDNNTEMYPQLDIRFGQ